MAEVREDVRKLQFTGGSTYIISLPKDWVREMNLEKGDRLVLVRQGDGAIAIIPEGKRRTSEKDAAIIDVSPGDGVESILRKIISTYLVGYDRISVQSKFEPIPSTLRGAIQNFARRMLVGTEIIYDSPKEIVLQVLLSYPELSVKSALRRMSFIATYMHEDAVKALIKRDRRMAIEVIQMDDEIDRFNHYIVRQLKSVIRNRTVLREAGLSTPREVLGYRLITKSVERMADHAVKIAQEVLEVKGEIRPEITEMISKMSSMANQVFKEAMEALFKQDYQLADRVVDKAKSLTTIERSIIKAISEKGEAEAASLRIITESIRRTAEYASDIAEIVLNLTINNVIET